MRRSSALLALTLIALAGCSKVPAGFTPPGNTASDAVAGPSAAPGFAITGATVQLPVIAGRPAVAYFTVTSSDPGKLVALHVDHFKRAEMHRSKMAGGMMTMEPVDEVALSPARPTVFAPGGYHVMLFDTDGTLKPGGTTELTVTLDGGDKVSVTAKVVATGGGDMTM